MAKKKKEEAVWKIVHKITRYSKKRGAFCTNITVQKDKTFQDCVEYLKKE
jgi:hypothetical protein